MLGTGVFGSRLRKGRVDAVILNQVVYESRSSLVRFQWCWWTGVRVLGQWIFPKEFSNGMELWKQDESGTGRGVFAACT